MSEFEWVVTFETVVRADTEDEAVELAKRWARTGPEPTLVEEA
jgi:hypothetical protein